jgi:hypothetical protein
MINEGEAVFLQVPDGSSTRRLHRGRILIAHGESCTAEFDVSAPRPVEGQLIFVYHESPGDFLRLPARVTSVIATGPELALRLQITGDPVAADRRRQPRVAFLSLYDAMVRTMVGTET